MNKEGVSKSHLIHPLLYLITHYALRIMNYEFI